MHSITPTSIDLLTIDSWYIEHLYPQQRSYYLEYMVTHTKIHNWRTPEDKVMCNAHPTWNVCTIPLITMLGEQ